MGTGHFDGVVALTAVGTLGAQYRTGREPKLWVIGANLDDEFAGDAVRFDHAPDCQLQGSSPLLVGVHHVDTNAATTDAGNEGAQRGRGAPTSTDHLAEVIGVNVHLDGPATPAGH